MKPFLNPAYCKGCGRCVVACPKGALGFAQEVNVAGYIPVSIDHDKCVGCGVCSMSCPEPYALSVLEIEEDVEDELSEAQEIAPVKLSMPETEPLMIKGTYAAAMGALLAGCRHFFGYPITPSTEGAELMAKVLPHIGGVFHQAVSEVATINHMYGCGGAGQPCMTFTSSPGFSLMLEGISYMIGARVPGVIVNVMRGGPGLGNIGPEQGDIKLACRGLGHGNTHSIVLAPADPQEMMDLTMLAFELTFKYRLLSIVLGDGYLGQVSSQVKLPEYMIQPGVPSWATTGDREHRKNLITSIQLSEADLEKFNIELNGVYTQINEREQRADLYQTEDCDILFVAANTPARMTKGAIKKLRSKGIKAGLFRPITLWPFPIDSLKSLVSKVKYIVVVEASAGQLEDEMRLALSYANIEKWPPIYHVQHFGGVLPQSEEIEKFVLDREQAK
ncbi:3-methyl-2-oxobutanoate dehydrogenase subunit VorB [bacterium]|nr:3-methyl-2-oxobutanoate dehydrogenase subunit VorB [bacterium]